MVVSFFTLVMIIGTTYEPSEHHGKNVEREINMAETYGKPRDIKITKGDKGTVVVVSMATTDPTHDALILKDILDECDVKGGILLDLNTHGEVKGTYVIK